MQRCQFLITLTTIAVLLCSSDFSRAFAERRYLIAVGVDKYQSLDVEFELHGASADVENVTKVLVEKFAFSPRPEWLFFNNEATFTRINAARAAVAEQAQNGDEVVFFFSGRGSTTQAGQPTIAPFDADAKDSSRDVSVRALCEWMNSLESKGVRVTVILDCGFAPPTAKGIRMRPKFYLRPHTAPTPVDAMEKLEVNGVLLTACKANELARECEPRRGCWEGVFTRFLVEVLWKYKFGESAVSWRQLISGAGGVAPTVLRYVSMNYDDDVELQTPSVYGKKDRALFSAREASPPSLPPTEERIIPLRLAFYNDGSASAQQFQRFERQLREHLNRLAHVRLTDSEESAHRLLNVHYANGQVRASLMNSMREAIGEPIFGTLNDAARIVEAVNERLGGTYWYRWLASLQTDASFQVQLAIQNRQGQPQSVFSLDEEAHFIISADRECYVALLEMNAADTSQVRLLVSSQKVSPPATLRVRLREVAPDRRARHVQPKRKTQPLQVVQETGLRRLEVIRREFHAVQPHLLTRLNELLQRHLSALQILTIRIRRTSDSHSDTSF